MRIRTLALALLLAGGSGFALRAQQPTSPPVAKPPVLPQAPAQNPPPPPPGTPIPPPGGPPPLGGLGPRRPRAANPFAPPAATMHYAPDRDYDLQHVAITLTVDYPHRAFGGNVVDTVAPLRAEGLTTLKFDCGANLDVTACTVGGKPATYARNGDSLMVIAPTLIPQGKSVPVMITYNSGKTTQGESFGQGDGGWHWVEKGASDKPDHVGFWTQGEPDSNRNWVPIWDYPNDFTTTETTITVPKDWTVISNGAQQSDKDNANGTHTVHWKMDLPHATYLISLVGGPFAVKTVNWEGVKLYYVAPESDKDLLESSFGNTPDMLSFYSKITGVKYAWPKYAQDAMYDFGGGMENVSATTLQESALTDPRAGYYTMDSLTSHELGHQWFGDFVTCKDWGQIWLNESFATYMQIMYFQHSRGQWAYDREIEDNMQSYFNESRRYKRPIATHLYSNPNVVFDRHTYPKGGVVLHTLRRQIGDAAFFAGLHAYLTEHAHTPVESNDLCEALTTSSGIDLQPFFDQWIYKPGHPVIDTTWAYDADAHQVVMTIKQTQDTSDGTPIYDLNPTIGIIANGTLTRVKTHINQVEQEVRIPSAIRPDAVLFDPDHDFLREIPTLHWASDELPFILKYSPNAIDRTEAMNRMLAGTPSDASVQAVAEAVRADTDLFPALDSIAPLGDLKREDLRPLFRSLLTHPSFDRRAEAINALGKLSATPEDTQTLRGLVSNKAPYAVVVAAVTTLGAWDANANLDVIKQATQMDSRRDVIRAAAFAALAKANPTTAVPILLGAAAATNPPSLRAAALRAMGSVDKSDEPTRNALLTALLDSNNQIVFSAAAALGQRHDTEALPALQALQANPPAGAPDFFGQIIDRTIQQIQNPDAPAPRFRGGGGG